MRHSRCCMIFSYLLFNIRSGFGSFRYFMNVEVQEPIHIHSFLIIAKAKSMDRTTANVFRSHPIEL